MTKSIRLFSLTNVHTQQRAPINTNGGVNGYLGPYVANGDVYVVGGSFPIVGIFTNTSVSKSPDPMSVVPQPNTIPIPVTNNVLLSNFELMDINNQPQTSATGVTLGCIDSFLDGTLLHICSYEAMDTDGGCFYNTFDTTTDTWGVVDEQIENTTPRQIGSGVGHRFLATSVRSDGDVIVGYEGNLEAIMAVDFMRADIGRRESGTWTVGISVSGATKNEQHEEIGSLTRGDATSDRMHFFYKREEPVFPDAGSFVAVSTYKSDNTFGVQDVSVVTTDVDNRSNYPRGYSIDRSGTQKIRITYQASFVNQRMYGWDDEDIPTPVELGDDITSCFQQSPIFWAGGIVYDPIDKNLYFLSRVAGPDDVLDLFDVQFVFLKAPADTDDWPVGNTEPTEPGPGGVYIKWNDGASNSVHISMNIIIRNGSRIIAMVINMGGSRYYYNEITIEKSLIKAFAPFKHIIVR